MRRIAFIAATLAGASVLAACQSQGVGSATPVTVQGTVTVTTPTVNFPVVAAFHHTGNPASGKPLFISSCGSCHTLADAGTSGTFGPNLDTFTPKPYYQMVTAQVTIGGALEKGSMPSFKSTLSTQQIADVAAYVVTATGGKLP